MTQADLERRVHQLERTILDLREDISGLQRNQIVLSTGIALARWLGPFVVAVAAVVISLAKGG